jgi:hypothetical protein
VFITNRSRPWNHVLFAEDDGAGSGEQPPALQDTAADGATSAEQQQAEVDWAKRYSDLQPEYTRTTQELSQLRQREDAYKALLYSDDQDTRQQAAQALGIELADDEVDDTQYDDPNDGAPPSSSSSSRPCRGISRPASSRSRSLRWRPPPNRLWTP